MAEINHKWVRTDMSGGVEMARTTFFRYKEAIQDIFGLIIECDRKNGYEYYIENEEVLEENTVQNWMLSTISISNMLNENASMQEGFGDGLGTKWEGFGDGFGTYQGRGCSKIGYFRS
ncbi:MAG: hypothetical protein IJ607_00875 [Bacteroidaceae bacterium]|nr:hypothetical protein [Bacteroidaceae bacterium]